MPQHQINVCGSLPGSALKKWYLTCIRDGNKSCVSGNASACFLSGLFPGMEGSRSHLVWIGRLLPWFFYHPDCALHCLAKARNIGKDFSKVFTMRINCHHFCSSAISLGPLGRDCDGVVLFNGTGAGRGCPIFMGPAVSKSAGVSLVFAALHDPCPGADLFHTDHSPPTSGFPDQHDHSRFLGHTGFQGRERDSSA